MVGHFAECSKKFLNSNVQGHTCGQFVSVYTEKHLESRIKNYTILEKISLDSCPWGNREGYSVASEGSQSTQEGS